MAVNWSVQVYSAQYTAFARPVTFTPAKSQPSEGAYGARGIFDTVPIDIVAENGSLISDTKTILDILESEFAVLPVQGDRVHIPATIGIPAAGTFEIIDSDSNGGGETTLQLRKWMTASP